MSLRAIKKRENQLNPSATSARQTLFKKSTTGGTSLQQQRKFSNSGNAAQTTVGGSAHARSGAYRSSLLQQQRTLLGRATHSSPELRYSYPTDADTLDRLNASACLVRTKSENDVNALLSTCKSNLEGGLLGAKSEVCLQTISSHSYNTPSAVAGSSNSCALPTQMQSQTQTQQRQQQRSNMLSSGTRSHRDLTQSAYGASGGSDIMVSPTRRRMSECSLNSSAAYSQRTSAMSSSALTLSSCSPPAEPNAVLRVPIIGYEVMEERARFTVYKLRVENPQTNDCWLVMRRYTDFVRLNTKLKQAFPYMTLLLPRKKIFGDNFNAVFLDNRVQGLQMFVNSVMSKEELRKCKMVREFFCLDEPPTYSESMEECRAIFEAQEETIAHLKLQISNKNDLILSLQQKLREEMLEKEQLKETFKTLSSGCLRCSTPANGALPAK